MSLGKVGRIGLLAFLVAAIAAYFIFDLGAYLTLDSLKARQADLATLLDNRPLVIIGGFFVLYVATTALSLPGRRAGHRLHCRRCSCQGDPGRSRYDGR